MHLKGGEKVKDETIVELLLISSQLSTLNYFFDRWDSYDCFDLIELDMRAMREELEEIRYKLLDNEMNKKMPNYEALIKERLS